MSIQHEQILAPESRSDGMQPLQHESFDVNVDSIVYDPSHIGLVGETEKFSVGVVAEIALPGETADADQHIAIIRLQEKDGAAHFAIMGLEADEFGRVKPVAGTGPRPIDFDESGNFSLGNKDAAMGQALFPGTGFSSFVSGKHLTLSSASGNQLRITDSSTNGTRMYAYAENTSDTAPAYEMYEENAAMHTVYAYKKAESAGLLDAEGKFGGRQQINRDTTDLEGKVDVRSWGAEGEAIVVESKKDPEQYNILRGNLNVRLAALERQLGRAPRNEEIAKQVYEVINSAMTYDMAYVDRVSEWIKETNPDDPHRKINLAVYLNAGRGVCRQMALATAWLGGEMVKAGRMDGTWTADVNQHASEGAHEWARYTAPDGEVYVSDTAQNYFGTLGESINSQWNYFRPGERRQYMAKYLGRQLIQARPAIIDKIPAFN